MTAYRSAKATTLALGLGLAASAVNGAVAAGDVNAGKALAAKCEACHGLDGASKIPEAPNIAGQVEPYLVKQLTAFKSGERQNDMMSQIAPALSENDVADLAAYYAAIEIKIGRLPGQ